MVLPGEKTSCCKDMTNYNCDVANLVCGRSIDKSSNIHNEYNCNFNTSLSNNGLIMIIIDAITRKVVNVNDAACQFYGYNKQQILCKEINELHNLTIEETYDKFSKIRNNTENRFIIQHKIANSEIKDLEVYSNIFTIGNKEFINSIIFDITEKIKHEKELKESKERYKKLVQLSPHAVMVHTGYQFIFVNKAGANLLEVSHRKELIGIPIKDFIHEEFQDDILKQIDIIRNTNRPIIGYDMKIVTATGKVIDVSMSSSRIQYDGEDTVMTIFTDITEKKETEKLLKKAEENKKKMDLK